MYFPDNMTWQYFFLDTYPGYFLQLLPLALLAGAVCAALRFRRGGKTKPVLLASLFVCYLAGLLGVTLLLRPISMGWYRLLYHRESGMAVHLNDILLNGIGIVVSTALCFGLRRWRERRNHAE